MAKEKFAKDHGGDGGAFRMSGATLWECVDCGAKQHLSRKVASRRTRTLCKQCGGVVYPSKKAQQVNKYLRSDAPPPKKRRCGSCGAYLRSGNPNLICSPCQRSGKG